MRLGHVAQQAGLAHAQPCCCRIVMEAVAQADDAPRMMAGNGRGEGGERRSAVVGRQKLPAPGEGRSEEHTSELQSLMRISYAVFCLKKKKTEREKGSNEVRNN